MKHKIAFKFACFCILHSTFCLTTFGQGTAFTYQGRLNDGASPATGIYDLRFTIYDTASAGNLIAGPLTNSATSISNGLFTVTMDFGNVFPGAGRWLEIAVRTNGAANFTTLNSRQALTPSPYAITAGNVVSGGLAGSYSNAVTLNNAADQFTGTFTGNGGGLTNVNAGTLGGLASGSFWQLGGNTASPGQFLGNLNNQPLELRVNSVRGLRLEPTANTVNYSNLVNVIGGSPANFVAPGVYGATIAGGGAQNYTGFFSSNSVASDFGVVGGGGQNQVQSRADSSTVGGGFNNVIGARNATISGGNNNLIQSNAAYATIGGGFFNYIYTNAIGAVISGGTGNAIQIGSDHSVIGGGYASTIQGSFVSYCTIAGGNQNMLSGDNEGSTIGGGEFNTNNGTAFGGANTIAGGDGNYAQGRGATVGGGQQNSASGSFTTVPGGEYNTASGYDSFAAGYGAQATNSGTFVWSDQSGNFASTAPNQFLIRAQGGVGIGLNNPAAALHVASQTTGTPQVQITQQNASDSVRLRMNSGSNLAWEMDVAAGSSPQLQFWYIGAAGPRLTVDTGGNLYATSFNNTSDKNAKENFAAINVQEVLDKVTALPITRWNFKTDTNTIHVGPMAQDFHAAFDVGTDDRHIATVDEEGVALAAIQGLNQKLDQKDAELQQLKQTVAQLQKAILQLMHGQQDFVSSESFQKSKTTERYQQ